MNQYQHLNILLAEAWDEIFHHLEQFDFSAIDIVFIDTVSIGTERNPACYYNNTIVLDPSIFKLKSWHSDYTNLHSNKPVHFVLLHELAHHFQATDQLPLSEDYERQADVFAFDTLKEMR